MPDESESVEATDTPDDKVLVSNDGLMRLRSAFRGFAEVEIARVAQAVIDELRSCDGIVTLTLNRWHGAQPIDAVHIIRNIGHTSQRT
jgi:hypothetical protein